MIPTADSLPTFTAGFRFFRQGEADGARDVFIQALHWHPSAPARTAFLEGLLHLQRGLLPQAEQALGRALALDPAMPDAAVALAKAVAAQGRMAEAVDRLYAAVRQFPSAGVAWFTLGCLLRDLNRPVEAVEAFHRAVLLEPSAPRLQWLGKTLTLLGHHADAVLVLEEACRLSPLDAALQADLGETLLGGEKIFEAKAACERAIALNPDLAIAHARLGLIHARNFGETERAVALFRRSLVLNPDDETVRSRLLLTLNYGGLPPEELFAQHRAWEAQHGRLPQARSPRRPLAGRKLRVGYVSADFKTHPVADFWEAIARHHDRSKVEVFCYADVGVPDDRTRRLQALADRWQSIAGMPDDQAARMIDADGVDVLVDLGGHAGGRLKLFTLKPAPVQVTYLGYPNTTGLSAMDYRLVDAITDPAGMTERFHSEQLVRLPGCFLCYAPPACAPAVGPLPCEKAGFVTFASFNQYAKLNDAWFARAAAILRQVPQSKLMLKAGGFFDGTEAKRRVEAHFAVHGIGPERLRVLEREATLADHLARYHEADIALDAFSYNGTTTTCEALWMGVPVVSLAGQTHVSRVGVSLLTAVGLGDLAAQTPGEFVDQAVALANDRLRLRAMRGELRQRMAPLLDGATFTRKLESAYRDMVCKIDAQK